MRRVRTWRSTRFIMGFIFAFGIIYLAFWTTPVQQIPANEFDEPEWLYNSFCFNSAIPIKQPDVCRGINIQTVDFSPTTKYVIALARWVGGIPANAVKYYYHISEGPHEALTADVRSAIVRFMIGFSTLSLLIMFAALWRLYGAGPAFAVVVLLVVTPYWRFALRGVMADPGVFFFMILTWVSTLWLVHRLTATGRHSLRRVLFAALCVGVCIGCGVNARANAALLGLSLAVVLVFIGVQVRTQWLTLAWAASVAFFSALCCWYAISTRLSWPASIAGRLQAFYLFNTVAPFGLLKGNVQGPADSLRDMLAAVFGTSYFMVVPAYISIPLCFLGMRHVFLHGDLLRRASGVCLLATGGATLLVSPAKLAPISWDRYAMFFVFAVSVFMAIGAWHVWEMIFSRDRRAISAAWGRPAMPVERPPRTYRVIEKVSAGACLVGAAAVACVVTLSIVQVAPQSRLWKAYISAPTADRKMDALSAMLESDSHAIVAYDADEYVPDDLGQPVSELLGRYYKSNVETWEPNMLRAVARAGRALLASSDNTDLRARIAYDLARLDTIRPLLSADALGFSAFANDLPASLVPPGWSEDTHELLVDPKYPVLATLKVPGDGSYQIGVTGLNPLAAPVTVGVLVDAVPAGTLRYDHQDGSWTSASVIANLRAGVHRVEFQLVPAPPVAGVYGAIRKWYAMPTNDSGICRDVRVPVGDVVAAGSCANEMPPVTLSSAQSRAIVTVTAPVPALYDLALVARKSAAQEQDITVAIDGKSVDGVLSLANFDPRPYGSVRLSPVYLTPGPHAIEVVRVPNAGEPEEGTTLTLKTLSLQPRYPDEHTLAPARFGATDPGHVDLNGRDTIAGSWKWYGHNFSFYYLSVHGSGTPAPLEVSVDGHVIGNTTLYGDGRIASPLIVELANGATHTLTLRARDLADNTKVLIYSVELTTYRGPQIYSATSMHWAKQNNRIMHSEGGSILLPARVRLTRPISLAAAQRSKILVHLRYPESGGGAAILHLNVDGWEVAETTVSATADWADATFVTFLPNGSHDLQFWWTSDATGGPISIMYFLMQ